MIPFNSFIEANQAACNNFLAAVSVCDPQLSMANPWKTLPNQLIEQKLCSLEEAKATELPLLHRKIVQNLDLITKSLVSYKNDNLVEPLIATLGDLEYWTGDINVEIFVAKPPKKK